VAGSSDRFVVVVGALDGFVEDLIADSLSRQELRDQRVGVRPFPRPQSERDADGSVRFVRGWRERLPTHDRVVSDGLMAVAFDEFDDPAGYITAWGRRAAPHCDEDVAALEAHADRPLSRHAVVRSYVRACYRQTGLGVALYVAAVRSVAPESVLCADACEPCGTTSTAARRLWAGASLAAQVRVEGLAAWGGTPTDRRANPPPRAVAPCEPGAAPRRVASAWPGAAEVTAAALPHLYAYKRSRDVRSRHHELVEALRAAGLDLLGLGSSRAVFALGDGAVVKVEYARHVMLRRRANAAEADRWRRAPEREARDLAPVLAASPGDLWLVMARAEPLPPLASFDDLKRRLAAVEHLRSADVASRIHNAGVWCGRVVLYDYAV
jgi:GNAT superfamily N-acetyltransferase